MISLKLSQEERDESMLGSTSSEKPSYGYGTCISLNDEQVAALGIGKLPVGSKVKIIAFGVINSARVEVGETDGEKDDTAPYLSIQLTDAEVTGASSVNASAMYPSSNG